MVEDKMNFCACDLTSYKPKPANERVIRGQGIVSWGEDNLYPEYLYDLYLHCASLQSIVNGTVDYICGNRIINNTHIIEKNSVGDRLEDVIRKTALDLCIPGGSFLQIIPNHFGDLKEVINLDFRHCREDQDETAILYSKRWGAFGDKKTIKYPLFSDKERVSSVFYYKGEKSRGYYPVPDWNAAIVSAETQIEIQKFHFNTLKNNFMANGLLSFHGASNVSAEERKKIEMMINEKFSGTNNPARLMLAWTDGEQSSVTFERFADDNFDKKYESLATSTRENIFIATRAIPVLFGQVVQTGFNTQEYKEAFALYNKTVVQPKQQALKRIFGEIFKQEDAIDFEPFTIE